MNKQWINRQKDRQIDLKKMFFGASKNPAQWVGNAGRPDAMYLHSPYMEGVTMMGSLLLIQ